MKQKSKKLANELVNRNFNDYEEILYDNNGYRDKNLVRKTDQTMIIKIIIWSIIWLSIIFLFHFIIFWGLEAEQGWMEIAVIGFIFAFLLFSIIFDLSNHLKLRKNCLRVTNYGIMIDPPNVFYEFRNIDRIKVPHWPVNKYIRIYPKPSNKNSIPGLIDSLYVWNLEKFIQVISKYCFIENSKNE